MREMPNNLLGMTERVGILTGEELLHVHDSQRPLSPPYGPATGSFNGLYIKSNFFAVKGLTDEILLEPSVGPRIDPNNPGLPMFGFPEISMHETFPWGGFGATPLTARAQGQWNAANGASRGGFPYSEGIYEDLTKAVYSQFYWNDQAGAETLKEYIAFEYSPDVVDEIAGVVRTLEQNHHWRTDQDLSRGAGQSGC